MEKNQIEVKSNPPESAESLWENFEKTGSIQSFLLYSQKTDIPKESNRTPSAT